MEETAAYANNHQGAAQPAAIAPLSKFEERKTKEKSRKVNTVTKFFTPSAKTPPKKDSVPGEAQSTPSPSVSRKPLETDCTTREFIDFLKTLKPGREIFKQCRAFTESMACKRVSSTLQ